MDNIKLSLSLDAISAITHDLVVEEGYRRHTYLDTKDNETIGYGFLLSEGLYENECDFILKNRISMCEKDLVAFFPQYIELKEARKVVLLDMCYNLGMPKLMKFTDLFNAIKVHDYVAAGQAIWNSLAAKELPDRYKNLMNRMVAGVF